jgi:hypothetical protein
VRQSRGRSRVGWVAGLVVTLCALTGCSGPAQTRAELVKSLDDAGSAVRTCTLALDLFQGRRVTRAVTSTTLQQQADELASVQQTLARLEAADPATDAERRRTTVAVQAGSNDVAHARMLLSTHGDLDEADEALQASGAALAALADQVQAGR